GIDECPPGACTVSSTLMYPFSAIPTSATDPGTPRTSPCMIAPLVYDEGRMDAAGREQRGDRLRARAAHLLIGAEGEVHTALRVEVLADQALHGLQDPEQVVLVVERPAAPHVPVGDAPAERRLGPAAFGTG